MPVEPEVRVYPDLIALSRAAAEEFVSLAAEAIQSRGTFVVALAGGSTPQTLYTLLASEPGYRDRVAWDKVQFFFTDERHVPPDHPDNNYRMAYRALLSKLAAPPWNAHRMATELEDAAQVAEYGEHILRQFFRLRPGELPRFDLILLGLGADAHTASLFPGSAALQETARLVVAPWVEKLEAHRITLTFPVLNHAAEVVFLVSGPEKAEALRQVLQGPEDVNRFPAQGVRPTDGLLKLFVDRDAARLLRSSQGKEEGSRD